MTAHAEPMPEVCILAGNDAINKRCGNDAGRPDGARWMRLDLQAAGRMDGRADVVVSSVPIDPASSPIDGEVLQAVAADHAVAMAVGYAGYHGPEIIETPREDGLPRLCRPFTFDAGGTARRGLAVYWQTPAAVHIAVASTEDADPTELAAVIAAVKPDEGVMLSAEEVIALAECLAATAPPVQTATLSADTPQATRELVLATARSSLLARGLLSPGSASALTPVGGLAVTLPVLLDGDHAVFITVEDSRGPSTTLLSGRAGQLVELAPALHGAYRLRQLDPARGAVMYGRLIGPSDNDDDEDAVPSSITISSEQLRAALLGDEPSGLPGPLPDVQRLVTVSGLRRNGEDLQSLELSWLDAGASGLWWLSRDRGSAQATLSATSRHQAREQLAQALTFCASQERDEPAVSSVHGDETDQPQERPAGTGAVR